MTVRTAEPFAEGSRAVGGTIVAVDEIDHDEALGEAQGGLERVGQPSERLIIRHEPVNDNGDVVLVLLFENGRVAQLHHFAVDHRARITRRGQLAKQVDKLTLLLTHDRGEHLKSCARLEGHKLVGDLLHRLPLNAFAAHGAMRNSDARPEQPHVIVDFSDRADR